ncbi:hypothetical protein ACFX14_033775 [Malus domestica]
MVESTFKNQASTTLEEASSQIQNQASTALEEITRIQKILQPSSRSKLWKVNKAQKNRNVPIHQLPKPKIIYHMKLFVVQISTFKIKPRRPLKKFPAQFKIKPRRPLDRRLQFPKNQESLLRSSFIILPRSSPDGPLDQQSSTFKIKPRRPLKKVFFVLRSSFF